MGIRHLNNLICVRPAARDLVRSAPRRLGICAVLATLAVVLSPAVGPPAAATYPGASGRIVFVDYGAASVGVIASTTALGTDYRLLTSVETSPGGDRDPTWSPGGAFIAFSRLDATGRGDIWVMRGDGSGERRLTYSHADDRSPTWSPDGSRLAFASDRDGDWEIYALTLGSGAVQQLTNNDWEVGSPTWSPNGDRVGFVGYVHGSHLLAQVPPDGSNDWNVLWNNSGIQINDPDWSPQADAIVFERSYEPYTHDIVRLRVSDRATTTVVQSGAYEASPVHNPAGSPLDNTVPYLAYEGRFLGNYDIVVDYGDAWPKIRITQGLPGDQRQPDWQPIPSFPLVDARFSTFRLDIEWVYEEGITVGCSPERYCTDDPVTRGQMATFLVRALGLPATTTDYFSDDDGTTHEADINRLAAAGITSGCAPGEFCPTAPVLRDQMASFLARAVGLAGTAPNAFNDDDGNTHEADINRVAASGIASGCALAKYCPARIVTRGEMAAFVHRAFD